MAGYFDAFQALKYAYKYKNSFMSPIIYENSFINTPRILKLLHDNFLPLICFDEKISFMNIYQKELQICFVSVFCKVVSLSFYALFVVSTSQHYPFYRIQDILLMPIYLSLAISIF